MLVMLTGSNNADSPTVPPGHSATPPHHHSTLPLCLRAIIPQCLSLCVAVLQLCHCTRVSPPLRHRVSASPRCHTSCHDAPPCVRTSAKIMLMVQSPMISWSWPTQPTKGGRLSAGRPLMAASIMTARGYCPGPRETRNGKSPNKTNRSKLE